VFWLTARACIGRYVQQVSKGAQDAAKAHGIAASAAERKKKKEAEEAAAREMAAMFAPAIKQPKPPPGAGPGHALFGPFRGFHHRLPSGCLSTVPTSVAVAR